MTFTISNNLLKQNISFGFKCSHKYYDSAYEKQDSNGKAPDAFVLDCLRSNFGDALHTDVLEIASGDGRNTIPIAKEGFNLTATEISPKARSVIKKKAQENHLSNIQVKIIDILSPIKEAIESFQAVVMTHLTQHFNIKEMDRVLKNVNKELQRGGIFVFDALVRNPHYEELHSTIYLEAQGNAHYKFSDLQNLAESNGFKIVSVSDYNEDPKTHAPYIHCNGWRGIGLGHHENKDSDPLSLKWLVLKKK